MQAIDFTILDYLKASTVFSADVELYKLRIHFKEVKLVYWTYFALLFQD